MNVGNYFHKVLGGKIWQVIDQTTLAVVKSNLEKKISLEWDSNPYYKVFIFLPPDLHLCKKVVN